LQITRFLFQKSTQFSKGDNIHGAHFNRYQRKIQYRPLAAMDRALPKF
jgi:hypothetical protein